MFKTMYSIYCVLLVSLMIVLSGQAHATPAAPFWVGTGVFEAASDNLSTVTYHPYRTPNFNTKRDCDDYLADAALLVVGNNVKGNEIQHAIHAKCVRVNSAQ